MKKPKTHDYTHRYWGHDYTYRPNDESGQTASMSGWGRGINEGDFLLLQNGTSSTRYRVVKIKYFADPPDMWSADVEFSPREVAAMKE